MLTSKFKSSLKTTSLALFANSIIETQRGEILAADGVQDFAGRFQVQGLFKFNESIKKRQDAPDTGRD